MTVPTTRRFASLFALFWVAVSLVMYYYAPDHYDHKFDQGCAVIYALMTLSYFWSKRQKNFLDFDTLFIVTYFGVMLYFPVFMYTNDPERFIIFRYKYNTDIISQGSALSIVGMACYMLGNITCAGQRPKARYRESVMPTTTLFWISVAGFIGYIALGGWHNLYVQYLGGRVVDSGIANYLLVLAQVCLYAMMVLWLNNSYLQNPYKFSLRRISTVQLLYSIVFAAIFFIASSRATPMRIILIFFGLYALFYRNFSLKLFLGALAIGVAAMYGLQVYRMGGPIANNMEFADLISDLIFNARNTYVCMDYVEKHGLSYGSTMLAYAVSPVPFANGLMIDLTGLPEWKTSSAQLITAVTLRPGAKWGLGTNIIADIYLAFGTPGVIILMYALGYFIAYTLKNAGRNIYCLTAYSVMMAYSVVLVRCEFLFPLRTLLWSLLIIWMLRLHKRSYERSAFMRAHRS